MDLLPSSNENENMKEQRNPLALVELAQGGDEQARNDLIRAYTPFVMRVAADSCGRYINAGRDDEASVALLAFNEAITAYREEKGSFLKFAETVIKRRLIDHFRKHSGRKEIPFSDLQVRDEEGDNHHPTEIQAAVEAHRQRSEIEERQDEIRRYQVLLNRYGISFQELVKVSPKHGDARETAKGIARAIAENPAWAEHLRNNRSLPMREMEREGNLGVSRKTLERNRRYIIAVAILLMENFDHLRDYVAG